MERTIVFQKASRACKLLQSAHLWAGINLNLGVFDFDVTKPMSGIVENFL